MKPSTRLSLAPRAYLFTARRALATSTRLRKEFANPFTSPAPPRLPQEDQKVFEELVQQSTGAFSSPRSPPKINQSPDSSPSEAAAAQGTIAARAQNIANSEMGAAAAQAAESSKAHSKMRSSGRSTHEAKARNYTRTCDEVRHLNSKAM
ncbi:uncharacterized protein AB675_10885 [Cyphellophora attinorum]|uniref:Uncharacterized protein n=1 Tax=Cyphellophora attinorum TaxID=1664694 RepID=A0A0N1NZL2_9EURO|nr:uncharacterized protein AB675_10885 [Phialophora attinorum]KPI40783.1 hypothetical protein AB675_10885 [Phialophora attinorum]